MLDRTVLGTSWDSVVSNGCGLRIEDWAEGGGGSPRSSPEPAPDQFCISRHNPNKTFRRENVIASWRSVKREREQALGKRPVYMPVQQYREYSGRNCSRETGEEEGRARTKVKRCRSERAPASSPIAAAVAARNKVKRTYSVLYRYDRGEEKVVKEYKYLQQPAAEGAADTESAPPSMLRSRSEPLFRAPVPADKSSKKAKRSLTAFLTIKTRILNIFSSKS